MKWLLIDGFAIAIITTAIVLNITKVINLI